MKRIDAHQHFWHIADRAGAWPPPTLDAIHRDFAPDDLAPLLAQHHIDRTVLVQSMPNEDDTRYMLDLADRHAFIGGVVGWVDLKARDVQKRIAALALNPLFKGLRPMLQDLDNERWIDDVALAPAVEAMLHFNLALDGLVLPRHLPALLAFAERYPDLPLVIDHCAKPAIARGELQPWQGDITRLAQLPQVHCKLSGLLTEAGGTWNVDGIRPYTDHILDVFGPHRVIWGSDWPVLNLSADYGQWIAASESLLADLESAAQEDIFGRNAERFYRL